MPRLSPPALLVAAVSMIAGVAAGPAAAYAADTTAAVSAAKMSAELKAAAPASTRAAAGGWRATMTLTGSTLAGSISYIVDPVGGVAFQQVRVGKDVTTEYAAGGKGRYGNLIDPLSRSAVKMMGRPSVRYVFTPDKSLKLAAYVKENAPSPATVLTEDTKHAGTRTVHDDGSVDYRFHDQQTEVITVHIGPTGVLTGAHVVGEGLNAVLAYTYGAQHVTLPAASETISPAALARGIAYLDMPGAVKTVAHQSADDARQTAHGHTVKVAALRKTVRRDVSSFNKAARTKMITSKSVSGGARVYATNPWTHQTVSYTVKTTGKKITVRKT
jgi:hypothetical protein